MAKKETTQLKWKKKKWYSIVASEAFGHQELGETAVIEKEELIGKSIVVNVMHLTKNIRKQNINLKFKVAHMKESKAVAETVDYFMQPSSIKRLVRAGRDRVDDSFVVKTQDNEYARVKPLFITRIHQSTSVHSRLRRTAASFTRKYVATLTLEQFFKDTVEGKFPKSLKEAVAKVCGLRNCEVRQIQKIENFNELKLKKQEKREEVQTQTESVPDEENQAQETEPTSHDS